MGAITIRESNSDMQPEIYLLIAKQHFTRVCCRFGALVGAVGAQNVSVDGGGAIDGRGGVTWWPLKDASKTDPAKLPCSRPHLLEFEDCDG